MRVGVVSGVLVSLACLSAGDVEPGDPFPKLLIDPSEIHTEGSGSFESWLRTQRNTTSLKAAGGLDLRVAKALGSKGYNKLRISVVTNGPQTFSDFKFTYANPFRSRWTTSFDMGTEAVACGQGIYEVSVQANDVGCHLRCSNHTQCSHYTWHPHNSTCELANTCDFVDSATAEATYTSQGANWLYSALVDVKPGLNSFSIGGTKVNVNNPAENSGVNGIIWSDPCYSSKFLACTFGSSWNLYERSFELLNAIAVDNNIDFFQILGDNFYDQTGQLTQGIYSQFSLDVKSKILMTVAGNHDLWVCGAPACGTQADQFAWGLMQFYGQDPYASTLPPQDDVNFLSFSANPDVPPFTTFRNDWTNLMWYNKVGNLGFIGYNGAATQADSILFFEEACGYMSAVQPKFVFLMGHWNGAGLGCAADMTVPAIYSLIQGYKGCDIGDRLKFFDGHNHCNYPQQSGANEEVGFLIGGHGMGGCSQVGFSYVDTKTDPTKLRIYYFEERSNGGDNYDAILTCIQQRNISNCVHLAAKWLETDI